MIAIYCRQSVDKQDSISIESQIEYCKKEFDNENYKIYTDRGYSGKDTHRPHFKEMIDDIKRGLIEKVVVYKLDRMSRSVLDFSNIMEIFDKHKVDFVSHTEKFRTDTAMGRAVLGIIVIFAQLERETIQQRITDNYYSRGKLGFFMGGTIPYGFNKEITYINNKKTSAYVNNDKQIPNVIDIFEKYAYKNMSLGKLCEYLNTNNILTGNDKLWDSSKVATVLRNPTYVKADADVYLYYKNKGCIINNDISEFIGVNGCFIFGKRKKNERKFTNVENHILSIGLHEGVIDSNTWLLCQYKLDSNKQIKNSGRGKYTWLSGVAKCGYCKFSVSVVNSRGHKYFMCKGKTNTKVCKGHSNPIYVEKVEEDVKVMLFEHIRELDEIDIDINNNDLIINKLKLRILEIDKQIENLINQLTEANSVVIKYVNEKMMNLDNEKNTLLEEIKRNYLESNNKLPIENVIEKINNWEDLNIEERKEICRTYIEKIFIFNDDEVEIKWLKTV